MIVKALIILTTIFIFVNLYLLCNKIYNFQRSGEIVKVYGQLLSDTFFLTKSKTIVYVQSMRGVYFIN